MSFDAQFEARWRRVLSPGLGHLMHNGVQVEPFRVDLSKGVTLF